MLSGESPTKNKIYKIKEERDEETERKVEQKFKEAHEQ
jgi:hypothetical protein